MNRQRMTQERLDRWFNHIISCVLNIALTGYLFIALSIWGPA